MELSASSTSSPTIEDCYKCKDQNGEQSICCDKCDRWTHYSCAELTPKEVEVIINYYCDECEDEEHLTEWRRVRGTVSQRITKEREYYEVQGIHDHREVNGKRQFLIEWKSDRPNQRVRTWEPEEHLDGAIDLLQQYCRKKRISLSKIVGLVGANLDSDQEISRANWADMDTILDKFQTLRTNKNLCTWIEAKQWTSLEAKDCLYFLNYEFHCYVLLYVHKLKAAYIADGGNVFRTEQRIANEIERIVKIRLISIAYDQQLKVDHCASSAILIGIELLRMHAKGIRLQKLISSKYWRNRLASTLHRAESKALKIPTLGKRRERLKCAQCAKTYKSTERKSLTMHINRVHKMEAI